MQLWRLSILLVGIALLVLAGILVFARQKTTTDLLLVWEIDQYQARLYRLALDHHAPNQLLTVSYTPNLRPALKIIGQRLYFQAIGEDGSPHLYRSTLNGHRREQVLPTQAQFVTLSPDEQWVYYTLWNGAYVLYRSHLNGDHRVRVADFEERVRCFFAPPTDWLACDFVASSPNQVFLMRPDGSEFQKLEVATARRPILGFGATIAGWSPDGTWLLFWSDRDGLQRLYRTQPNSPTILPLVNAPYTTISGWSQDGQSVYTSTYRRTLSYRLSRHFMTNEVRSQVVAEGYSIWLAPDWSDSWRFMIMTTINGEGAIYRMHEDGSDLQQLTDLPGREYIVTFSPDGNWLYFSGSVDNNSELMRLHLDSLETERLTHTPDWDEGRGLFSPDGQWLIVVSKNAESHHQQLIASRPDGSDAHPIYGSTMRDDLTRYTSWSSPPDFNWHAPWLSVIGIMSLAGAFAWRRA